MGESVSWSPSPSHPWKELGESPAWHRSGTCPRQPSPLSLPVCLQGFRGTEVWFRDFPCWVCPVHAMGSVWSGEGWQGRSSSGRVRSGWGQPPPPHQSSLTSRPVVIRLRLRACVGRCGHTPFPGCLLFALTAGCPGASAGPWRPRSRLRC